MEKSILGLVYRTQIIFSSGGILYLILNGVSYAVNGEYRENGRLFWMCMACGALMTILISAIKYIVKDE